ncbi:hypothetical protein ACOSQ3_005198 [Xanthoceras sorbifolium]
MKREFLNLKQRQMSVTEYEREFTRLSKYASEILVTEEDKCRRFEDGLNDYIRVHITAFEYDDYSRLISAALNVERVKKEEQARKDRNQNKRNPGQSNSIQDEVWTLRVPGNARRWIELIKDYDCVIDYHPGKANVLFTHRQMDNLRG